MLVSRSGTLLNAVKLCCNKGSLFKTPVRNSHAPWNYRVGSQPQPKILYTAANLIQGFAWWWVLWHLWTQFDHISGEFEYPDASKWTNEELGIPPEE